MPVRLPHLQGQGSAIQAQHQRWVSETYKNPDFSSLKNPTKPSVAGFATMGRLQLNKDEDKDRDPEGTRTCHRLVHWLK